MMHFDNDDDDADVIFDDYEFWRALHLSFLTSTLPSQTTFEPLSLQQMCVDHLEREKMPKTVDSAAHLVAVLPDLFDNSLYKGVAESVRQFLFARATWLLEKYHHYDLQERFGHELYNALVKIDKERTMALKRMASFRSGKMIERTTPYTGMQFDKEKNKRFFINFARGETESSVQTRIVRSNASNTNAMVNNNSRNSTNNSRSNNISNNNTSNSSSSTNNSNSNTNTNIQQHPNNNNPLQIYYPLERLLQGMIWPEGVNPAHREQYLSPTCFFAVFGMTKEEFSALKHFVKERKKKERGLF